MLVMLRWSAVQTIKAEIGPVSHNKLKLYYPSSLKTFSSRRQSGLAEVLRGDPHLGR